MPTRWPRKSTARAGGCTPLTRSRWRPPGRFSSNNPNLQNIPIRTEEGRRIRRAFVAEPGHLLLSADYSQIELRLAAHVADVPELKQAFRDGVDIHALTASQVFGVPLAAMDANTQAARQGDQFRHHLRHQRLWPRGSRSACRRAEAGAYIRAYFERFPAIRAYMERIKTDCRRTGYVETIFGRKCFIPGIRDANPARRAGAERQAINAPLQGSAADIIKRAMARIPAALAGEGLRARMLLQVHDELLFEVPEAEVDDTAQVVKSGHGRRLRAALRALGAARRRDRLGTKLGRGALKNRPGARPGRSRVIAVVRLGVSRAGCRAAASAS